MRHKYIKALMLGEKLLKREIGCGNIYTMLVELAELEYPNITLEAIECRKEFVNHGMTHVREKQKQDLEIARIQNDMRSMFYANERAVHLGLVG